MLFFFLPPFTGVSSNLWLSSHTLHNTSPVFRFPSCKHRLQPHTILLLAGDESSVLCHHLGSLWPSSGWISCFQSDSVFFGLLLHFIGVHPSVASENRYMGHELLRSYVSEQGFTLPTF